MKIYFDIFECPCQFKVQITTGDNHNKWCLLKQLTGFCFVVIGILRYNKLFSNQWLYRNFFQPATSQNSKMKWGVSKRSSWIWVDLTLKPWCWLETWSEDSLVDQNDGGVKFSCIFHKQWTLIFQTSLWLRQLLLGS